MKTSAAGRQAIMQREGCKLKAYKDSVGIWTIFVGHTTAAGPPAVKAGMTGTMAEAEEVLSRDLAKFEKAVNGAVKVPLTQNQFDALVSLAFNIGGGAFVKSTLVKRLNKGEYGGAAAAFMSWDKAGGKKLAGLTARRNAERKQFLADAPNKGIIPKPAPLLAIEPKPAPAPAPVTDKELVKRVQTALKLLNYNPGPPDGLVGPLTAGAIRIFRSDNGLPDGDSIDDALITTLATAKPREMVAARANATVAQVAAVVPEANVHWWTRLSAGVLGGGVGGVGLLDQITPAVGYLTPVKDFIGDVPPAVWIGGIVLVCAALYVGSQYGANKATAAYQAGDRR